MKSEKTPALASALPRGSNAPVARRAGALRSDGRRVGCAWEFSCSVAPHRRIGAYVGGLPFLNLPCLPRLLPIAYRLSPIIAYCLLPIGRRLGLIAWCISKKS